MQHKNIKRIIKTQLKRNHPHWKKLPKKDKKAIAKSVLAEVVKEYDFSQTVDAPLEELIGIEDQLPTAGIMNFRGIHLTGVSPIRYSPRTVCRRSVQTRWMASTISGWPWWNRFGLT